VDPSLQETPSTQCYRCLTPLTAKEQADERYVPAVSCPYCFKTSDQQRAETLAQRHAAIRRATQPLPGSQPYDNHRPVTVSQPWDGFTLLDFLGTVFDHVPLSEWQALCEQGRLLNAAYQPVTAQQRVQAGERYLHLLPGISEPEVNPHIQLLYEDEAIIVLDKPAPLPLHPSGRFNRNTLQQILKTVYHPQKPRPVHRLDANTTGVMVWARTHHFAGQLQPQFAQGTVEKVYLARVHGHPPQEQFISEAPISSEPGALGTRTIDEKGLPARTEFWVRQRDPDGTTLLEARPLTGRTNQIRVHLWQLGWPICGDQVYLPDQKLGTTQTLAPQDPPLCLHAWRLTFTHPLSRERFIFKAPPPAWSNNLV
jgi:RluA family pseudouridine synthase